MTLAAVRENAINFRNYNYEEKEMSKDIIVRLKQRKVTHTENYTTSELTCRSCGSKEEIEGTVDINNLSKGWTALSLDALETGVFKWLLCPICTKEVRFAAGL